MKKLVAILLALATLASLAVTAFADDGVTEISIWHMEEVDSRVQQFNMIAEKFNAAHSDIKVTFTVTSWDDAYSKVPAAIMAGNGPDMLQSLPDYGKVIYDLGVLADVTDMVAELDEEYGFFDSAVETYTYDGRVYAVPAYDMAQVLWYRKDLFAAAGLEAPKTWDDVVACAKALTDKDNGKYGIALPASLSMATDQVVYSIMASCGGADVVDEDDNVTFDNPGTVKAFEYYQELLKYAPVDCDTYTWGEPQALFNEGTVAMAIEKGQYLSPFETDSGVSAENLGCVLMPVLDDSCTSTAIHYVNSFMVLAQDEQKQAAILEFLKFLLSEEAYGDFLNAEPGLFLPVTETGATYESWTSNEVLTRYPEQVATLCESAANGALFGFTNGVCDKIGAISGPYLIAQPLQQMTVNGLSPADAVAWGQVAMEEAIEEY